MLLIVIALFLAIPFGVRASVTDGTIDTVFKYAWGENIGWINFGSTEGDVHINASGMTGYAWGENIGWISLNCSNTGTCGTVNYGVSNDGFGNLSGFAWGENIGWVNFGVGGVAVDQSGHFSGYAWGENIGWISLNCLNTGSCGSVSYGLNTDYIPATPTPTPIPIGGDGGGGFTPPPSPSGSATPTPSASASPIPTPTPPPSPTSSATPTPSVGPSATPTESPSGTPRPGSVPGQGPTLTPTEITVPGIELLPQPVQIVVNQTVHNIVQAAQTVVTTTVRVTKAITPAIQQSAPIVTGATTVATTVSSAISIIPLARSASNFGYLLQFLRQNLIGVFGLKRKRKVWGSVYNSKTKKPIPFAKVELLSASSRLLDTRITDTNGRYGFLVTPESINQQIIEIQLRASKDGFAFPASGITPPDDTILYANVYIGGITKINVQALAAFDLPMDEIKPKELSPSRQAPVTLNNIGTTLLNACFNVGLVTAPLSVIAQPSVLNISVLAFFCVVNVPRLAGLAAKPYGVVIDSLTGSPMSFALITLNDNEGKRVAFTVSDERGRYFLLVPKGEYTISAYTPATVIPARNFTQQFKTWKGWVKQTLRF